MKQKVLGMFFVCIMLATAAFAQDKRITGKVTSREDGLPLPGVSVKVAGTKIGTQTDANGNFSLSVPSISKNLEFSFIGFLSKTASIGNKSIINVLLENDAKQLSEVIVVGYGEQSKTLSTQTVSTVNAESFKNTTVISPQDLLQGQAAGVQMTGSSGLLGAASAIRIRGAASITAGGQPLFVIDGVPLNDGSYTNSQGGGAPLNPLLTINSNDIESLTVLKDAAAVSIYGSRGANGVVLIKTKSGGYNSATKINVDYFTGVSEPTGLLKYMNTSQWSGFVNESRVARGLAARTFPTDFFDWTKGVVRTGRTDSYNINATGGDDKTKFFVGGNFNKNVGFTLGNDLNRLSGRFNFEHQLRKNIKVGVNYSLSRASGNRINTENSTYAPLTAAYLQLPYVLPTDANGQFVNTGFVQNTIGLAALDINTTSISRSVGNAFLEARFLKDFKIKTDFGIDQFRNIENNRDVDVFSPGGYAYKLDVQDYKWINSTTLSYNKVVNKHTFGGLLGYSYETSRYDDTTVEGIGFASDNLPNVGSASTPTTTSATGSQWALESQFVRLNYNFNNKYLFEATGRRDGSSRFGSNKRYGLFYAISGGWILSEESFLKDNKVVNYLKLNSSYGTSGNDRIGNFLSQELYGGGTGADYISQAGLIPTQVPNPDLTWEETSQFDVTLSSTIFKVVDLEVSYYAKNTSRLLAAQQFPYTTGIASATRNVGKLKNSGIDFQLTTRNYNKKDFQWTTSFNVGYLKNEVVSLPENKDPEGRDFLTGSSAQRAIVGESLNTFYLVRYKGVNPATGDAEWLDKNGNATTTYSTNNRVIVGSALPRFTGGISNNFRYKNFDLGLFFQFVEGNKILIDGLRFTENINTGSFNKSTDLLNYWKNPGDNVFAPKLGSTTAANFQQLSTSQLQNGSYLRLKTTTIGFNVPKSLLNKSKVFSSARVYVLGQNLLTVKDKNFRGPDPEVSANGANNQIAGESFFALPQSRTFTFGVNFGF